jgi:DNA ligase (NAD+)
MSKEEMKALLLKAADAYYNKSNSIISDAEFDKLYDEFKSLHPNDPFLKTLGSPVDRSSAWEKATHKIPMGSLNKVTNIDEFLDWARKHKIYEVCISEKLDGISIDLEYYKGKLVKAITRGDGEVGEDITKNALKMQNVKTHLMGIKIDPSWMRPMKVPFDGSLRGEIILKQGDFESIVAIQKSRGETPIKNLRNGASGIAKRYDGKYSEYLSIIYYDVTEETSTKAAKFHFIKGNLGLPTAFIHLVDDGSISDVIDIYDDYEAIRRASLDYEIDGLVIECNDIDQYTRLGSTDGRPKGTTAFKFTSIKKETTILDVTWQLGKSGTITPVVELEPVEMGGVTVRRASLHNLENFKYMNLHHGDIVLVSRRNDVIPYVEKVVSSVVNNKVIEHITNCPVCDTPTQEKGKFLVCPNPECDGSKIGDLKKWASVTEMQSLGMGGKTIEKLFDDGLVVDVADLYTLQTSQLENLEGFGKRSAEKIIEIIDSKRELPLAEFIGGLNIRNFSTSMVELLVENGYDTLDKIFALNLETLVSIKGIEEKTATTFLKGLNLKLEVINKLLKNGVKIKENKVMESKGNLGGMSFCFTGAVQALDESGERYKRGTLESLVKENGGEVKSVSSGLTYLVQADPSSTSSKSEKAKKFGVKIISDIKFLEMIRE